MHLHWEGAEHRVGYSHDSLARSWIYLFQRDSQFFRFVLTGFIL